MSRLFNFFTRSPLLRNTAANAFGQFAAPLLNLLLVPFYVSRLGLEGYGLLVFFSTLGVALTVFSSGIGWALSREASRRNASPAERETLPGLIRTFEVLYWTIAAAVAVAIFAFAPWIAAHWLETSMPAGEALMALRAAGLRIGLAFPFAVYYVVLQALQRQVQLNSILSVGAVVSAAGAAVAVALTSSVTGYTLADGLTTLVTVLVLSRLVRSHAAHGRFQLAELSRLWRMSLSLVWVHGVGVMIKQLDRIIMSKLLPLASLGVYSAGTAGGRVMPLVYAPFTSAVYPQTCAIAVRGDDDAFAAHVIRNATAVFVFSLGAALPAAFFPADLLLAWTRNASIAAGGAGAMVIFVIAAVFNAGTHTLYQSHVAKGLTAPAVRLNTFSIFWFPLALWGLVARFGVAGAAGAWLLYSVTTWLYYLWTTPALTGRKRLTYLRKLVLVTAAAVPAAAAARWLAVEFFGQNLWLRVSCAIAAGGLVLAAGGLTAFGRQFRSIMVFRPSTGGALDP
ncbi:MAG TPA: oligosaccharide flippase family protein [Thermoanaerobaculia bacterium]|nr:oligosaccharide flippase family protein [Thermoanaerobaculia bacterium]